MNKPKYKLVCFDVDGTLIDDDGEKYWHRLNHQLRGEKGHQDQLARYKLFCEGKLGYKEWVDIDIEDLRREGNKKKEFERVARTHHMIPGARETVLELHKRGYKLAVISGSLNILIDTLFPDHPFDDLFTNEIAFDDEGKITSWKATVYDEGTKHKALHAICKREGIKLSETVFVGDGENDIDILQEAGLGIAFCPKTKKVEDAADIIIKKKDMKEILKYL